MKPRQLTITCLGSAIGAGLFIGSGAGIQAARPAVLISYLVAGTLIILVMWALGEMPAANPDSGAFSVYTAKACGPVAGATMGGSGGSSSWWSSPPKHSGRRACWPPSSRPCTCG
ncbi:amino acid permease [Arthrobacter sp. AG367]|uniref:amino acid permease n=1 Tax=Arthrobacter sp. AG367 TaxID=2572909 RepID=UPI0028F71243|nr:amino acid permease [Arthrobacter sp. AG367]